MNKKIVFFVLLVFLAASLAACGQQTTNAQQTPVTHRTIAAGRSLSESETPVFSQNGTTFAEVETNETGAQSQAPQTGAFNGYSYTVVDSGQDGCYSDQSVIICPSEGEDFYGQDAQYQGVQFAYQDNGDGTISDLNTGLMWQQSPDLNGDGEINSSDKLTYAEALQGAETFSLAGYDDWRLPTIKELYSLMNFNGITGTTPYFSTDYFDFAYGDTSAGERDIDAQFASSTLYVGTVMNGRQAMFGLNLADGRIKGYPTDKTFFVLYVRGNPSYGINDFVDNGNGTISDLATGLTWMQTDSGSSLNWEEALSYCENLDYAGTSDWRLPNAKELHSIVDYTRSPQTTNSAAIDPLFAVSEVESWYWSSTTHLDGGGKNAVYIAFGQAFGLPNGNLVDVHGAGAQRSDPKSGNPADYPDGRGTPGQDDQIRIYNYARCVSGGVSSEVFTGGETLQIENPQQSMEQSVPGTGLSGLSGPPQEAIDACTGLPRGSACTIDTPNGSLSGSCSLVPSGEVACVPEKDLQNGNQRP